MGNNQSSGSKSATPSSSHPQSGSSASPAISHDATRHHPSMAGISRSSKDSPTLSSRSILSTHAPHRSAAAPPEPSLAQAHGSTSMSTGSRPKSISAASSTVAPTAMSSLNASPLSSNTSAAVPVASKPLPAVPLSQQQQHRLAEAAVPIPIAEPSKPVDVPGAGTTPAVSRTLEISRAEFEMTDPQLITSGSITGMYNARPPRLPLPIEEEVHTPGSPILGADETVFGNEAPELEHESSGALTRKSSAVSQATIDDEDSHELRVDRSRSVVPTRIEWNCGGEKVYVTGTIFQWSRKQRLQPVEGKPGCFAGTVYVLPGTHHVRFVVDAIMKTSPDLPTTVDFGNNLVNYIEVSAEMTLQKQLEMAEPGPDGQAKPAPPLAGSSAVASSTPAEEPAKPPMPKYKAIPPPECYRREIPQYLLDFDQPEDSPTYQSAVGAIEKMPTPPSLPGFLSKPILNAATLMKDDNSVLNMPNHTVLNHLATSSIKNNVLAVCATTRYRGKYVTTIVYKPTSADEG